MYSGPHSGCMLSGSWLLTSRLRDLTACDLPLRMIRCAHEGTAVRDAGDLEAHCMQPLRMARRLRNCVCTLWVLYDDAISGKQKEGSSNTEPDSSATARKSCRLPKRREIVALIGIADLRWHEELSS